MAAGLTHPVPEPERVACGGAMNPGPEWRPRGQGEPGTEGKPGAAGGLDHGERRERDRLMAVRFP